MPKTANDGDADEAAREMTTVLESAGIHIAAIVQDDRLFLEGAVETEEMRVAALDIARALIEPLGLQIQDDIQILTVVPDSAWEDDQEDSGDFAYTETVGSARLEPDFSRDPGTVDPDESDEGVPFFPPTDPVVEPSNDEQQLAVGGGFQSGAMDDQLDGQSPGVRGDGELQDILIRELREDALTIDMNLEVNVWRGVVTLQGEVGTLDDAANAEAVAARVDGVQEVREELRVRTISGRSDSE